MNELKTGVNNVTCETNSSEEMLLFLPPFGLVYFSKINAQGKSTPRHAYILIN